MLECMLPILAESSLITGLHPCGDLSATILRLFIENAAETSSSSSLLLLGCCYHKLNGGLDKPNRQEWSDVEVCSSFGYALPCPLFQL